MKPILWPTTALFLLLCMTGCPDYSALREPPDYTKMTDSGDEIDIPSQSVATNSKVEPVVEPPANSPPAATGTASNRTSRRSSTDWTTWIMYGGVFAAVPVLAFVLLKWTPIFRKTDSVESDTQQSQPAPSASNSNSPNVSPSPAPNATTSQVSTENVSRAVVAEAGGDATLLNDGLGQFDQDQLDDDEDFDLSGDEDFELNVDEDFDLKFDTHEIVRSADDDFELAADDDFEPADEDELDFAAPTENSMNASSSVTQSKVSALQPGSSRDVASESTNASSEQDLSLDKRVAELAAANQSLTEKVDRLREQRNVATKKLAEKIAQLDQIEQSKTHVPTDQLSEMSHEALVEALRSAHETEIALAKRLEQTSLLNQRLRKKLRQKMDVIRKVAKVKN